MTSKWHRRVTKYKSIRIEIGAYVRLRAMALEAGVTRGALVNRLLDVYDGGRVVVKREAVPEAAKVVTVTFEEEA